MQQIFWKRDLHKIDCRQRRALEMKCEGRFYHFVSLVATVCVPGASQQQKTLQKKEKAQNQLTPAVISHTFQYFQSYKTTQVQVGGFRHHQYRKRPTGEGKLRQVGGFYHCFSLWTKVFFLSSTSLFQHQSARQVKSWKSSCSSAVSSLASLGGVSFGFSEVNSSSKLDTSSRPVWK